MFLGGLHLENFPDLATEVSQTGSLTVSVSPVQLVSRYGEFLNANTQILSEREYVLASLPWCPSHRNACQLSLGLVRITIHEVILWRLLRLCRFDNPDPGYRKAGLGLTRPTSTTSGSSLQSCIVSQFLTL